MSKCLLCKTEHDNTTLDLGLMYPSAFIDSPEEEKNFSKVETRLIKCPACNFVQLSTMLPPDSMYRRYWYRSSANNTMVAALKDVVKESVLRLKKSPSKVIDIGCNDFSLLKFYDKDVYKIGFDPADNLVTPEFVNKFYNDYFVVNDDNRQEVSNADIITSIAMFYDVPDPHSFIEHIKMCLSDDGIWVIQLTDIASMVATSAFDNICHEHIAYYSLDVLKKLLNKHSIDIFDVEYNNVNGASIRVYCSNAGKYNITKFVDMALEGEAQLLYSRPLSHFPHIINNVKNVIHQFIKDKKVFCLGASTKGNTLLQVLGINSEHIPYALEVSEHKIGKFTLGSNIKIISEAEGFALSPKCLLVLPWHFIESMTKKYAKYLYQDEGGLISPLPVPTVYEASIQGTIL